MFPLKVVARNDLGKCWATSRLQEKGRLRLVLGGGQEPVRARTNSEIATCQRTESIEQDRTMKSTHFTDIATTKAVEGVVVAAVRLAKSSV